MVNNNNKNNSPDLLGCSILLIVVFVLCSIFKIALVNYGK